MQNSHHIPPGKFAPPPAPAPAACPWTPLPLVARPSLVAVPVCPLRISNALSLLYVAADTRPYRGGTLKPHSMWQVRLFAPYPAASTTLDNDLLCQQQSKEFNCHLHVGTPDVRVYHTVHCRGAGH